MNVRDADHRARAVGRSTTASQADGADLWPVVAVQAAGTVLQLRAVDRVPAGRPRGTRWSTARRGQARHAGRPRVARPGPHRLGQPHPLVALARRPPARDDLRRVRDRRRPARHLARGRTPRSDRAARLRRAGRVGARQRHRPRSWSARPSSSTRTTSSPRSASPAPSPTSTTAAPTCSCSRRAGEHVYLLTHYVRDAGPAQRRGGGARAHGSHRRVLRPRTTAG